MQQLELFDYRRDYLFDNKNQIAHWYDILKESEDTISYAEHIDPNTVSYTHLRAHETVLDLVCRLLLEKKNNFIWWARQDSNLGPIHYECTALTN